ncbi:hypothetical protein [Desmospora profundinema]|uniref:Lactococcin 972 family bacteriocin n=1 Tax=Desmospora profundinema TaxID=1571184 RepID=A0ABU1IPL1_9BACL|nr:hypothetical protein [Desmospora profundinema]MDR6226673.1 hypothetical protein [Desmospora profundinema]
MNIRKKLIPVVAAVGLLGVVPSMAFADEETGALGGWTEGEGYWTKSEVTVNQIGTMSSKPDFHRGWKEGGRRGFWSAVGETGWKNVHHYTRARMVYLNGNVNADSGRKWGISYTYAKSPLGQGSARTYYGR